MDVILFDLEETLIDSWDQRNLLVENVEKIKEQLIGELGSNLRFGIFSWAIWNEDDREDFNQTLRGPLEEALGIKFDPEMIFSMQSIADLILKFRRKKLSIEDVFDLFGKEECLLTLHRFNHFNCETVALVDDRVDHGLFFESLRERRMAFINITEL